MGLDFGLEKMNKELFNSFNGDKEAYYAYDEEHWNDNHSSNLVNYCGWGNPIEQWFKDGLHYYNEYDGILMRALTPEDIYAVIKEAYEWYHNTIDLQPVMLGSAFQERADGSVTLYPVDGVEVMNENENYCRFHCEDSDGRLFMTKEWIDGWDIYKFPAFVNEMMNILMNFDWENDVLLYYVSY